MPPSGVLIPEPCISDLWLLASLRAVVQVRYADMLPSGALANLDIMGPEGRPDDRLGPARRQAQTPSPCAVVATEL